MLDCRRLLGLVWIVLSVGGAARAEVTINEIMYNTPGFPDVEYVELINSGLTVVDLTGWYLIDDDNLHDRCFLVGSLAPGEYLVVAGRLDLFTQVFPLVTQVNLNEFDSAGGSSGFSLGNTTELLRLFDGTETLRDQVPYTDTAPWPTAPDGWGPSMELLSPLLDNALPQSWGSSNNPPPRGTPGSENTIFIADLPPVLSGVTRDVPLPQADDTVVVTAAASDDLGVATVELFVDVGTGFVPQPMLDAGGLFETSIAPRPTGSLVRYYAVVTDTLPQTDTFPAGAPSSFLAYTVGHIPPRLVVNEILASNQNGIEDGAGEQEDWVEILNLGITTADLQGMFLSDRLDETTAWPFPAVSIPPGGSTLIWCDDEPQEGVLHATFRLSRSGGEIGLFESVERGNVLIHGFTFGTQSADVSFGFVGDRGDAPEYLLPPTPLANNAPSSPFSDICINEFLTGSQLPGVPDWIELYNRGTLTVDIGGWHLSDDVDDPKRYPFPVPTLISPGAYLSVDSNTLGFGLSRSGEQILLADPSGLVGYDYIDFGEQFADVSLGRVADGATNWHFLTPTSQDLANQCDPAIAALEPIAGLRALGPTAWEWDASAAAVAYDTIQGDLADLRASGGSFTSSFVACHDDNSPSADAWDPVIPAAGAGYYYLVRGVNVACGFGTYDSGSSFQSESRDPEITAAVATCP